MEITPSSYEDTITAGSISQSKNINDRYKVSKFKREKVAIYPIHFNLTSSSLGQDLQSNVSGSKSLKGFPFKFAHNTCKHASTVHYK
jgi:hypothetical protein